MTSHSCSVLFGLSAAMFFGVQTAQSEELRGGLSGFGLLRPVGAAEFDDEEGKKRLREKLIESEWRIAKNGLRWFFEDERNFGVSDWGKRRGIWMVAAPNRVAALAYDGSHQVIIFNDDLTGGTLYVNGLHFSKLTRPLQPRAEIPKGPLFESVLGTYGKAIRGPRHPFINLRPPARNLWTSEIEEVLSGSLSYGDVDYIGTALLVISNTGMYTIDLPGAGVQLRLNGQLVERGERKLLQGFYDVELYTNHWGQPYLKYAHARVIDKGTKRRIPFVNTAAAIEEFRSSRVGGNPVVEVCDFATKRVNVDAKQDRRVE